MNKRILLALAVVLVSPLAALADPNFYGTPDASCWSDGRLHDYVGAHGPLVETDGCALGDSHPEWAMGGAGLLARSGDGLTSGSLACYGAPAHHPQGGVITVTDAAFPGVVFVVSADATSPFLPPSTVDCGDGILEPCNPTPPAPSSLTWPVNILIDAVNGILYILNHGSGATCNPFDQVQVCVQQCAVAFPPGADGAYVVSVVADLGAYGNLASAGTVGHIHL